MAFENGDRQQDQPAPHSVRATPEQQLAAVEATVHGFALFCKDGRILYANRAYAALFGYDNRAALLGRRWQSLYTQEDQQRFAQDILPQCWQAGSWLGEAIAQRRNGTTYPQALSLTQMADGGIVCIAQGIAEQKLAESSLRHSEAGRCCKGNA